VRKEAGATILVYAEVERFSAALNDDRAAKLIHSRPQRLDPVSFRSGIDLDAGEAIEGNGRQDPAIDAFGEPAAKMGVEANILQQVCVADPGQRGVARFVADTEQAAPFDRIAARQVPDPAQISPFVDPSEGDEVGKNVSHRMSLFANDK